MFKMRLILFCTVLALGLAACTAPETDTPDPLLEEYTFRSIDEIIDAELEVTNFAPDGTASLPIRTSIPVACSVVYGATPAFGSLSLDQDMAGGTHADHSPILSGLEPETTYYFRVQGVDDDGIVYLSEVMTFEVPALEAAQTDNLASPAMGATIVGYSSAFGAADPDERWGASSAFDNSPNTEWSSAGDGNEAWIEVELARRARIESIEFQSRAMSDGSAITRRFTITTDSGEVLGPFELPDVGARYPFEVAIEAQTLRFDLMDTTGGNTGVVDIVVYGEFLEP